MKNVHEIESQKVREHTVMHGGGFSHPIHKEDTLTDLLSDSTTTDGRDTDAAYANVLTYTKMNTVKGASCKWENV